jgi:DNA topoisomerase-3
LFGCHTTGSWKAADILFKTTGKEILKRDFGSEDPNAKATSFVVGEKGPHQPHFRKGNQTTESILRKRLYCAMETAGAWMMKICELMKENGIGRPTSQYY